jgi:hypothetical protein
MHKAFEDRWSLLEWIDAENNLRNKELEAPYDSGFGLGNAYPNIFKEGNVVNPKDSTALDDAAKPQLLLAKQEEIQAKIASTALPPPYQTFQSTRPSPALDVDHEIKHLWAK